MIRNKYWNRFFNGKCLLILTSWKKPKRYCFLKKAFNLLFPDFFKNNISIKRFFIQKYLSINLDKTLNLNHHIKENIDKAKKGVKVIKKQNNILLRSALLTIYRTIYWLHLDYVNIIYDKSIIKIFLQQQNFLQIIHLHSQLLVKFKYI